MYIHIYNIHKHYIMLIILFVLHNNGGKSSILSYHFIFAHIF